MPALRTSYSQNRLLQPSMTTWQNCILHLVCIKFTLHKMDTSFEMFKRCSNHLHLTFFLLLCYWLLGVEDSESNLPHGFVADIKAKELFERQPELQYFWNNTHRLFEWWIYHKSAKGRRPSTRDEGMNKRALFWDKATCWMQGIPGGLVCSKLHCSMNSRLTCNCRGPSQCTVVVAQYFSPCYVHNWTSYYRYCWWDTRTPILELSSRSKVRLRCQI